MAVSVRIYLNVIICLVQIALAATVLAMSFSLQRVKDKDEMFLNHPPTLLFVVTVGGLTIGCGMFGLALTWLTCLVQYGYVADLVAVILNLAAGTLLSVKIKWSKGDCSTHSKRERGYNGPAKANCGKPKLDWLTGDKCEHMGMRCSFSRVASVLCFVTVGLLLVTLASGHFVKSRMGPPAAKRKKQPDGDVEIDTGTPGV